jgi:hypothetical protein
VITALMTGAGSVAVAEIVNLIPFQKKPFINHPVGLPHHTHPVVKYEYRSWSWKHLYALIMLE